MLPDVDNQNLAGGQGEQGALALKVLILTTLATVSALNIHDEDVVGHGRAVCAVPFVLRQPYSLGRLASLRLGHDTELGAKKVVEQGRLAR